MQENLPQKGSRRARNGVAGMERERETGGSQEKNQQARVSVNYSGKDNRRKKVKNVETLSPEMMGTLRLI